MLSDETRSAKTLIRKWVELLKELYPIYTTANPRQKVQVLKGLQVELFVGGDLSLAIQENRLLECVRNCSFEFGTRKWNQSERYSRRLREYFISLRYRNPKYENHTPSALTIPNWKIPVCSRLQDMVSYPRPHLTT